MSDLVNRKTLIGAIEKFGEEKIYPQALIETIKALLSAETHEIRTETHGVCSNTISRADADRPTGEWVKATGMMPPEFHGHHCCSECGNFANMEPPFGNREDLSEFCPNCGADMQPDK